MDLTLCRRQAVQILEETEDRDKNVKYLVKFADSEKPQWADRVTPRLLARWRIKQHCGEEKSLVDYLGLSPDNLAGAVSSGDLQFLAHAVVLNIHSTLAATLNFSKKNKACMRTRYDFTIPCKPKVYFLACF